MAGGCAPAGTEFCRWTGGEDHPLLTVLPGLRESPAGNPWHLRCPSLPGFSGSKFLGPLPGPAPGGNPDGFRADPSGQGGRLWRNPEAHSGEGCRPETSLRDRVSGRRGLSSERGWEWGWGWGGAEPWALRGRRGPCPDPPHPHARRNWPSMRNSRIRCRSVKKVGAPHRVLPGSGEEMRQQLSGQQLLAGHTSRSSLRVSS